MSLWYPYKQMKHADAIPSLQSAQGVLLHLEDGRSLIDGISSWWAVIHGYNHPALNKALEQQAAKFAHVMLGGLTHLPALALADKLVAITPAGLNYVFFSDSGSIGVEVALKMAIQYWKNEGYGGKHKIISLKNGYHGDTFKAMEVSDDSDFSHAFEDVLHRGYFLDIPTGGFDADLATVQPAIDALELLLKTHHSNIACFILEPIVQCAGGFNMYSPLFLKAARLLCDTYNVLLIFDEVATGFGRTGKLFAANHAGISPDIMILGKALTAGYMGHAATLANNKVYNAFLGDNYDKALMHGPTFMANALACAVALRSIEIFEEEAYLEKILTIEKVLLEEFSTLSSPHIVQKRVLGAIGAIEMKDEAFVQNFKPFALANGAWLRPIGKVIYLMPAYVISDKNLRSLITVIRKWVEAL